MAHISIRPENNVFPVFFLLIAHTKRSKMKKIPIPFFLLISMCCYAQTYYCPLNSVNGVAKKLDQWFIIQDDALSIKIVENGKVDSLHYKKITSTNPSVVYFKDDESTSSLTIVHSSGSMKGTKYTDVLSYKKDLQAQEAIGLWYCTQK